MNIDKCRGKEGIRKPNVYMKVYLPHSDVHLWCPRILPFPLLCVHACAHACVRACLRVCVLVHVSKHVRSLASPRLVCLVNFHKTFEFFADVIFV